MHPHLEILLEIQDLKSQRGELADHAREMEEGVFNISVSDAVEQIERKVAEMEGSLPGTVRNRYQRLAGSRGRVVVPVIGGTCYGCFVSVPTALASDADRNQELQSCDNCGRFLYVID